MTQRALFNLHPDVRVEGDASALWVHTPYSPAFVAALKAAVPGADRRWEPTKRAWQVSPAFGPTVQRLIEQHFSVAVDLPQTDSQADATQSRILDCRYIGAVKVRADGTESAYGWCDGGWTVLFPKAALLAWFGVTDRPGEAQTLYQVMGVTPAAGPEEVKRAWRRLARQWHPEVCTEPDAAAQFHAIQRAYAVLSDAGKRARYDAGLALAASLRQQREMAQELVQALAAEYRPPLRCGLILAQGVHKLGRFVVDAILQWVDIHNARGQVLVTSWPTGAQHFEERWVDP